MPRRYLFLTMHRFGRVLLLLIAMLGWHSSNAQAQMSQLLNWQELPSLPDPLGVAGPFAGVHEDALIVAGGANFPQPVWDNDKVWRDAIYVLTRSGDGWSWQSSGKLPRPLAYGATVSTPKGVLCIGETMQRNLMTMSSC